MNHFLCQLIIFIFAGLSVVSHVSAAPLRLATFQADVTPPLGSPLCNGLVTPAVEIVTPLTARGVILLGAGEPIVLCAMDWVAIANESYDRFRESIAEGVGTTVDRVALHTLHQHDAPGSDFATEQLLAEQGLGRVYSNPNFDYSALERIVSAAKESLNDSKIVTDIGLGSGEVKKVASNRRILGPDGRVALQRQSSGGRNPVARKAPEGTIDPQVKIVVFWHKDQPITAMTYYATHPQSYYGNGAVNWDFVGMARNIRDEELPEVPHVHFNGAGGNIAAGKYNDGSKENRPLLAGRLADGMKLAWESQKKFPITTKDVDWRVLPVLLPVRRSLVDQQLIEKLNDTSLKTSDRIRAARDLTFVRKMKKQHPIPVACLKLGNASILHMPGELFVEYQLAAQQLQPNGFVAMAAYGDSGPGYIGTQIAYSQGGYETGVVSRVEPEVEAVLMDAIRKLLTVRQSRIRESAVIE